MSVYVREHHASSVALCISTRLACFCHDRDIPDWSAWPDMAAWTENRRRRKGDNVDTHVGMGSAGRLMCVCHIRFAIAWNNGTFSLLAQHPGDR